MQFPLSVSISLSISLLAALTTAIPAAQKSCSGTGFPCGNATINALDCCVPLVCVPGVKPVCQVPPHRLQ